MIIYEVNLSISMVIFSDYFQWLMPHIQEMLTFDGFKEARILRELNFEDNRVRKLTIQYTVDSIRALDDYFKNHAQRMREGGLKKFQGKFTVTRRIFEVTWV